MTKWGGWGSSSLAAALCGVAVLSVNGVTAQSPDMIGMVTVTVEADLECSSCAQGLERRLNRLDGVAQAETRVTEGQVVLTPELGDSLDLHAVREVVLNAGFLPTGLVLTAVGRVVELNDVPVLLLSDGVVLALAAGEQTDAVVAAANGRIVRMTGRMCFLSAVVESLRVDTFKMLSR